MKSFEVLFTVLLGTVFLYHNVDGLTAENIRGGHIVDGDQNYVVAIVYYDDHGILQNPCTGTIIGDWHVLTVAHCFYDKQNRRFINQVFYTLVSVYDLTLPYNNRYIFVDYIVIPDSYDLNGLDSYANSAGLAVIKVSEKFGIRDPNSNLESVEIGEYSIRNPRTEFAVSGYGWHSIEPFSNNTNEMEVGVLNGWTDGKLRCITANIITEHQCRLAVRDDIAEGNMCTKAKRRHRNQPTGICQGDSGAGLIHVRNLLLYGVAINGFMNCDEEEMPGLYIDAPHYKDFIDNVRNSITTNNMRIYQTQQLPSGLYGFNPIPELV